MGAKIEKSETVYTVSLTVSLDKTVFTEDNYDKSTQVIGKQKQQVASIDISGTDWEILKGRLHSHIDLV